MPNSASVADAVPGRNVQNRTLVVIGRFRFPAHPDHESPHHAHRSVGRVRPSTAIARVSYSDPCYGVPAPKCEFGIVDI